MNEGLTIAFSALAALVVLLLGVIGYFVKRAFDQIDDLYGKLADNREKLAEFSTAFALLQQKFDVALATINLLTGKVDALVTQLRASDRDREK